MQEVGEAVYPGSRGPPPPLDSGPEPRSTAPVVATAGGRTGAPAEGRDGGGGVGRTEEAGDAPADPHGVEVDDGGADLSRGPGAS
jgi:hypothetical protein